MLPNLAARLDSAEKRVDRLETLEYSTVAFPSGGALVAICDIILAIDTASITFCTPPPILLTGFRHLFGICHYFSDVTAPSIPGKMEMNFNGDFGAVYLNYTRQENFTGPPFVTDTEVPPIGFGTDTKFSLPTPSRENVVRESPAICFFLVPAYDRPSLPGPGNFKTVSWWGYSLPNADSGVGKLIIDDQGGGEYRRFAGGVPPAPIVSITLTHPAPGLFKSRSHFTLYGLP